MSAAGNCQPSGKRAISARWQRASTGRALASAMA